MLKQLFFAFVGVCLLSACSEGKKPSIFKKKDRYKPFLINIQNYFSESEQDVSFPIWFDDSMIVNKGIKTIKRSTYALNEDIETGGFPKEVKVYHFDKKGQLEKHEVIEYYENVEVSHVQFDYLSGKDENGFAKVRRKNMKKSQGKEFYHVYQKEKYAKKFLAYRDEESGDYLFYMMDEHHLGPLSIDTILKPTPSDVIVLGSPDFPEKRYQVENRVKERNVVETVYNQKMNAVEEIRFEKEPFTYHRTVNYSKEGDCQGFVDSTFSIDQFLMARTSDFKLNRDRLPARLVHKTERHDDQGENIQYETFEYVYFE